MSSPLLKVTWTSLISNTCIHETNILIKFIYNDSIHGQKRVQVFWIILIILINIILFSLIKQFIGSKKMADFYYKNTDIKKYSNSNYISDLKEQKIKY